MSRNSIDFDGRRFGPWLHRDKDGWGARLIYVGPGPQSQPDPKVERAFHLAALHLAPLDKLVGDQRTAFGDRAADEFRRACLEIRPRDVWHLQEAAARPKEVA